MYSTNKPHVHKDVIIAWAKGAEIQTEFGGRWETCLKPSFSEDLKYRIKPDEDRYVCICKRLDSTEIKMLEVSVLRPYGSVNLGQNTSELWSIARVLYDLKLSEWKTVTNWNLV